MSERHGVAVRELAPLQVNAGCGRTPTVGWLNFDNSLTVRLARFPLCLRVLYRLKLASKESLISVPVVIQRNIAWADATKRLPLADESVAVVYSSHMLGSCPKSVIDDNHFRSNELWCGGLRAISPRGG